MCQANCALISHFWWSSSKLTPCLSLWSWAHRPTAHPSPGTSSHYPATWAWSSLYSFSICHSPSWSWASHWLCVPSSWGVLCVLPHALYSKLLCLYSGMTKPMTQRDTWTSHHPRNSQKSHTGSCSPSSDFDWHFDPSHRSYCHPSSSPNGSPPYAPWIPWCVGPSTRH